MTRAAIYYRISQDDGTALGVARQEADCRSLCGRRGWTVAAVHTDNNISASSGSGQRSTRPVQPRDPRGVPAPCACPPRVVAPGGRQQLGLVYPLVPASTSASLWIS
jgi:Resolvase, N terminal domain